MTNTFNLWRDGSGWVNPVVDGIVDDDDLPPG